jgi:hypothetical protein
MKVSSDQPNTEEQEWKLKKKLILKKHLKNTGQLK